MKIRFIFLVWVVFLILPSIANSGIISLKSNSFSDGVNPVKKSHKKSHRKIKISGIRAIVRKVSPKVIPEPVVANTNPRLPYEILCSENRFVLIKISLPEMSILVPPLKIQLVDYQQIPRSFTTNIQPKDFILRLGLVLSDELRVDHYSYDDGTFIFTTKNDALIFDKILYSLREKLPFLYPFEIKTRFGCVKSEIALKTAGKL